MLVMPVPILDKASKILKVPYEMPIAAFKIVPKRSRNITLIPHTASTKSNT